MIVLDTHIWIWWVDNNPRLSQAQHQHIQAHQTELGVSIISCWEVAKLVELGRLQLSYSVKVWLNQALQYPGVILLDLTPDIVIESTQLPSDFHRDPADQMIVATARLLGCSILTADSKILNYTHVETLA